MGRGWYKEGTRRRQGGEKYGTSQEGDREGTRRVQGGDWGLGQEGERRLENA